MELTKKEKYENPALSFSSTEIILKMERLKTATTQYSCDIPEQVSLKHKSQSDQLLFRFFFKFL